MDAALFVALMLQLSACTRPSLDPRSLRDAGEFKNMLDWAHVLQQELKHKPHLLACSQVVRRYAELLRSLIKGLPYSNGLHEDIRSWPALDCSPILSAIAAAEYTRDSHYTISSATEYEHLRKNIDTHLRILKTCPIPASLSPEAQSSLSLYTQAIIRCLCEIRHRVIYRKCCTMSTLDFDSSDPSSENYIQLSWDSGVSS